MLVSTRRTLAKDLVGSGGPNERFGAGIRVGDVIAHLLDQDFDTAEVPDGWADE